MPFLAALTAIGSALGGVGSILGATKKPPPPQGQVPAGVQPSPFVFSPEAIYGTQRPGVQPILGRELTEPDYGPDLFLQFSELMKGVK